MIDIHVFENLMYLCISHHIHLLEREDTLNKYLLLLWYVYIYVWLQNSLKKIILCSTSWIEISSVLYFTTLNVDWSFVEVIMRFKYKCSVMSTNIYNFLLKFSFISNEIGHMRRWKWPQWTSSLNFHGFVRCSSWPFL